MIQHGCKIGCMVVVAGSVGLAAVGCNGGGGREVANVNFSYVIEKEKGLPPGMKSIAIVPAKVGETTDPKWSDMSSTILASLINESKNKFGTPITVTERRDTKPVFEEADLAAAGMSTKTGGKPGQLEGADGYVLGNINVKVETHVGKQRTLSGVDLSGLAGEFRGDHYVGGRVKAETSEVETVTRNMTVQSEFKLVDATNGRVWEHYSPRVFRATEQTKASPIFGSSKTEAELTPQDRIVATLVERAAREFVSMLMPVRVDVEAEVRSSGNPNSSEGIRRMRAEDYHGAVEAFNAALADNPNDHRTAFAAGVAAEAMGNMEMALNYYNRACAAQNNAIYTEARDRVKSFNGRVRKA
jgi:curli biogenesis system outer membrane secretion channel CsgG